MMEDPRTIGLCTHLLFVAKNIERAGDHATNIAETVYHMVTGDYLRDRAAQGRRHLDHAHSARAQIMSAARSQHQR